MRYVGVDVGGTTIKLGYFEGEQGDETLREKWEIPTDTSNKGSNIQRDIVQSIEMKCRNIGIGSCDLSGIGVGVPGPVTSDGTVLKCANLGWGIIQLSKELRKLIPIENIIISNDANVAALGEMWKGGGQGFSNLVMVTLGTGIGGGIILDGKIHAGSNGAGGEIGHITVCLDEEEACGCGNYGCIEQYASASGIVRLARRSRADVGTFTNAKAIFDAAKSGDIFANTVVDEFARYLGIALSNVANVVDPQAFVIGGGVSKAGTIITERVQEYYKKYSMYALKNAEFHLAQLGNDAGIYGCVKMAVDNNK